MNTFINQPTSPQKPPRKKRGNFFKRSAASFLEFIQNDKVRKVSGSALVLASVYLLIAFNSYIYLNVIGFPKNPDADLVQEYGWGLFWKEDPVIENRLGKLGALLAHEFIYKQFGITSYCFILIFLIAGLRALKVRLLPLRKCLEYSFYLLAWLPITLSLLLNITDLHFLGGSFGFYINRWLIGSLGFIGTAFLLFFVLFVFMTVKFNIPFRWFRKNVPLETVNTTQPPPGEMVTGDIPFASEINTSPPSDQRMDMFGTPPVKPEKDKIKTDDVELTILDTQAKETPVEEFNPEEPVAPPRVINFDPKADLPDYQYPQPDLLNDYSTNSVNLTKEEIHEELEANKNRIVETLRNYNIEVIKIYATIGPTVTLYEIIPAPGTRISKIRSLQDDIALSLSALGIRIIAPIPGKGTIGIEVPNRVREVVSMKTIISSDRFKNSNYELPIGIGKTISNETFVLDLTKMPHLLVAGATGQGKSVGLNAIIISLLYNKHPSLLKFIMIDPKKVELTLYGKLERHFLAKLPNTEEPIVYETKKVIHTLNSLCTEMENRLELLNASEVNDIKPYNVKFMGGQLKPEEGHRFLPYIVVVIDEFGDLIMTAGKEIEHPLARIAQLARATGIHLVIATQRPSVNIITGTIKANFPARMAFRTVSQIDSRTILDERGAEQLVGKGDMLIRTGSDLVRLQCSFVDTPEVQQVTEFIAAQKGFTDPYILPEFHDESAAAKGEIDSSERDTLFDDAARIVVQHQQGSASLLQRKLKLGYNRAGRIVDQLEASGIIGPFEGSKARSVVYKDLTSLEQYLHEQNNKESHNGEQE